MGLEYIVVGAVVLLLFGSSQLPKLARSLGSAKSEFEKGQGQESKTRSGSSAETPGPEASEKQPPSDQPPTA